MHTTSLNEKCKRSYYMSSGHVVILKRKASLGFASTSTLATFIHDFSLKPKTKNQEVSVQEDKNISKS